MVATCTKLLSRVGPMAHDVSSLNTIYFFFLWFSLFKWITTIPSWFRIIWETIKNVGIQLHADNDKSDAHSLLCVCVSWLDGLIRPTHIISTMNDRRCESDRKRRRKREHETKLNGNYNFKLLNSSTMDRLQWRVTGDTKKQKSTQLHTGENDLTGGFEYYSKQWHRFSMKLLINLTNLFNRIMAFLLLEIHRFLYLKIMHHHLVFSIWWDSYELNDDNFKF